MRYIFGTLVCSIILFLGLCLPAYADGNEIFIFEISTDGENWITRTVEVPADGYVEVDFGGQSVWLWGSEFDEEDLPPESTQVLCRCSVHMTSKCVCENWCAITQGGKRRQGTCI